VALRVPRGRRAEMARALGLSPRTLRRWRSRNGTDLAALPPPGRPPKRIEVAKRSEILKACEEIGGRVGYPTIRRRFPDVAARALKGLLRRRRRVLRRVRLRRAERLEWTSAGTVWATDFATPAEPIEGLFPKLLLVRDLASGMELAIEPVKDESAASAIAVLDSLFERQGAPLVLKSDLGSAFRSKDFATLLGRYGVAALRSPAQMPRYNGACESSVRWAKERVADAAYRLGRRWWWTREDLATARNRLNETVGDRGARRGTTASERWHARDRVAEDDRRAFRAALDAAIAKELERHGAADQDALDWRCRESLLRYATRATLERLEYLTVRRGRDCCTDSGS